MQCPVYQCNDEGLFECNTQCISVMMKVCVSVAMWAISQNGEVMQ